MTAALLSEPAAPGMPCRLAEGTELVGQFQGSGRTEASYLIRLASGRMLEVSPLLHLVATELGHERDLNDVAIGVSAQSGRTISRDSVAYLIDQKLRPLGIVTSTAGPARPASAPVLGLALHAGVLPTGLVRAVTTVLRPLFKPAAVVAVLGSLLAVEAWLLLGPGFGSGLHDLLLQPIMLLTVIGLTLVAGVFHELGHATASRYGGAKPGVIGAGIYLIWPVFYNDLNDSYRLSKGGRLRADLGGLYFNAIFILALAAGYGLTGFRPLLVAIAVQHLAVLQQFAPFLRLDGYYIVSDIAGVPDLFGRIRPILASLVPGRAPARSVTELRPMARRIVTGWVLLSVPLLSGCLVLLLASLPRLIAAARTSTAIQAGVMGSALRSGAVVDALLSGIQLLILAVPFLGLAVALMRIMRRTWHLARTRRDNQSRLRLWLSDGPAATRALLRLVAVIVVLQTATLGAVLLDRAG